MTPEVFQIVLQLQHPRIWELVFEQAANRRKEQAGAETSYKYANQQSGDPDRQISDVERANWRRFAQQHEHHAEQYRQAIITWTVELVKVQNYCRLNAPHVLPLIPNIDPFGEPPTDFQALANRMVEVEAALRLAVKPSGKPKGHGRKSPATPEDDALLRVEFKSAEEEEPGISVAKFARSKKLKPAAVRAALDRAKAAEDEIENTKKTLRKSRNLD